MKLKKKNSKHTITLGVTPSSMFDNKERNFQILGVRYNVLDGDGDCIHITLQMGMHVETIRLTPLEAIDMGFINPDGLKKYTTTLNEKYNKHVR